MLPKHPGVLPALPKKQTSFDSAHVGWPPLYFIIFLGEQWVALQQNRGANVSFSFLAENMLFGSHLLL